MALTELQRPTKVLFYSELQEAATQMNRLMNTWRDLAEFIGMVETADLDAMLPDGVHPDVRPDLIEFRSALTELIDFFDGTSTTQTVVPGDIVDKIRRMR